MARQCRSKWIKAIGKSNKAIGNKLVNWIISSLVFVSDNGRSCAESVERPKIWIFPGSVIRWKGSKSLIGKTLKANASQYAVQYYKNWMHEEEFLPLYCLLAEGNKGHQNRIKTVRSHTGY